MDKDLEATLKKLPELMREREEELKKREKELQRLKESLEEEHPNLGQPDDVLCLNVGGTYISVLRRTLTQGVGVEGSMLASRFSGRWDDNLAKDSEGRFFIDQDIELFLPLVNYLRDLATETPLSGPPTSPEIEPRLQNRFYRMLEYYGLTLGVYPICIYRLHRGGVKEVVGGHPEYEIECDEISTYCLLPKENVHQRYIQSFEVTLGPHSIAQVGWMNWNNYLTFLNQTNNGYQGAGYGSYSMAFDCGRSGMVVNGQYTAVPNCSVRNETVIRCENKGESWHIDGTKFASTISTVGNVVQVSLAAMPAPVPCLTVKGSFRITTIESTF